jgi:BirA family biotin operon repressor/biotin-[acetyl-CoA-carboxylase] ligase
MLDADRLAAVLPVAGLGSPLYFYNEVGSTNDQAMELARGGGPHGALVVADTQTRGRGRAGRRWSTPPGSALAMSLILRPEGIGAGSVWGLNVLGALGVAEAIEAYGVPVQIKWPNDVLAGGGKLAGVLVEVSWEEACVEYAVLGIGVNVRPGSVPPDHEVDFPAICVEEAVGRPVDRAGLLRDVIAGVGRWYAALAGSEMLEAWEKRLAFVGERVSVRRSGEEVQGVLEGLTREGGLRIVTAGGLKMELGAEAGDLRPVDRRGA